MTVPAHPLCVRLPNWVGDVCMALPALALLRRAGWDLRLYGKGWAADLLAGLPDRVDKLPPGLLAGARALADSQAREILLLTNSFGSALMARLAGLDACGTAGDGRTLLLRRALPRRRGHEVDVFWRLAGGLIASHAGEWTPSLSGFPQPPPRLALPLHDRHRHAATSALQAAGVHGSYIVLCPLAVGTIAGRSKVWPHFSTLATDLRADGLTIVACPGPGEEAATAAALPGAVLLPGLGLGAYGAVLAGADGVVANDSGPMHLAAAVDAPVLGIFGVSDPRRTRPWGIRCAWVGSAAGWPDLVTVRAAFHSLMGPRS